MKPGLAVPGPRLHHHLLHVAVGVEELAYTVGNIVLEIFIFINVPICPLCSRASNEPSRRFHVYLLWVKACLA